MTRIRHLPNVEEHLATIRPRPPRGSHHPPIYTRARALVLRLTLPVTNCLCDAQAQVAYEGGVRPRYRDSVSRDGSPYPDESDEDNRRAYWRHASPPRRQRQCSRRRDSSDSTPRSTSTHSSVEASSPEPRAYSPRPAPRPKTLHFNLCSPSTKLTQEALPASNSRPMALFSPLLPPMRPSHLRRLDFLVT